MRGCLAQHVSLGYRGFLDALDRKQDVLHVVDEEMSVPLRAPLRSGLEGRGEIQDLRTRTSNRLRHEVPDPRAGDQRFLPRAPLQTRWPPSSSASPEDLDR